MRTLWVEDRVFLISPPPRGGRLERRCAGAEKSAVAAAAIAASQGQNEIKQRRRTAALLFDFPAPDWLHRSCDVFRCVLIGCTDVCDVVPCCDVDLLIGCMGSEDSFVA